MASSAPTAYGPSWYAATMVAAPRRAPLNVELDVDVCVIGGGLAGLTAAREVARRGWSVVLLEARRIAWNASGTNTGFVLPGFAADPASLIARVGLDHAKSLWALSEAGAEYVRTTIRETQMPGAQLNENGWLHVSKTGCDAEIKEQAALLAISFGAAVEHWPAERVRAALRSPLYFSAVNFPRAFTMHSLNYALGLAAAAEAAGARIFEETPLADQILLLEQIVKDPDAVDTQLAQLTARYLAHDIGGLLALSREFDDETLEERKSAEAFMRRLIDDRNVSMVERMLPRLRQESAFIAVGALHLPGEKGILQLLTERGYTVSAVY